MTLESLLSETPETRENSVMKMALITSEECGAGSTADMFSKAVAACVHAETTGATTGSRNR